MEQRIIKFRAWDKQKNKMLTYSSEIDTNTDGPYIEMNGELRAFYYSEGGGGITDVSERFVLMQYTGIKNFYEGDIVRYKWRSGGNWVTSIGIVNYKAPEWLVGDERFVNDGDEQVIEVKDHEVIGNQFEHPHLLTTPQKDK